MDYVELEFRLTGKTLPADHGYAQYAAIKKILLAYPDESLKQQVLSGDDQQLNAETLFSSISGVPDRKGMIYLDRRSRFRLRCPQAQQQAWYRILQSQVLEIQGHLIRLVQPRLMLIDPHPKLSARLVTFKLESWDNHHSPVEFLKSTQKALDVIGIQGQAYLDSNENGDLARRALRVKGRHILGYGVTIENLSPEDSLKLQCYGLGGRKHFGCGWFFRTSEI